MAIHTAKKTMEYMCFTYEVSLGRDSEGKLKFSQHVNISKVSYMENWFSITNWQGSTARLRGYQLELVKCDIKGL